MLVLYADHSCRGHGREEGAGKTTDCVVQCHDPLLVFPPCVHVVIFSLSLSHSLSLFFCCCFLFPVFPLFVCNLLSCLLVLSAVLSMLKE